jgi:prepilin-type N-terminal cleavage/methylation domain-containing protein
MRAQTQSGAGFTLIEVVIAMFVVGTVLVTVPLAATKLTIAVSGYRIRNEASAMADAWIARCRGEPNYAALDSSTVAGKCAGTVSNLGSFGFTRTTTVTGDATLSAMADTLNDYKRVTVRISGGGLPSSVSRTITIAKP